jgi:hypothetical protein
MMLLASVPIEAVLGISLPLAAIVAISLTAILSYHRRRMQRDDMEATLKMEMIERGFSAEEIERVLASRMNSSRGKRHACGPARHAADASRQQA